MCSGVGVPLRATRILNSGSMGSSDLKRRVLAFLILVDSSSTSMSNGNACKVNQCRLS
jgi:hypothetical protein